MQETPQEANQEATDQMEAATKFVDHRSKVARLKRVNPTSLNNSSHRLKVRIRIICTSLEEAEEQCEVHIGRESGTWNLFH